MTVKDVDGDPVPIEEIGLLDKVARKIGEESDLAAIDADTDWYPGWPESQAMRDLGTGRLALARRELSAALAEYAAETKKFRRLIAGDGA